MCVAWRETEIQTSRERNRFAFSQDFGRTWEESRSFPSTPGWPRIATDNDGTVFCVHCCVLGDIVVNVSIDAGSTWRPNPSILADRGITVWDIEASESGEVSVLLEEHAVKGQDYPWSLNVHSSADGGTTWNTPVEIARNDSGFFDARMARDSLGHVYVAWTTRARVGVFSRNLFLRRSIDGGMTFEEKQRIGSGPLDTVPVELNGLEADQHGGVFVLFGSAREVARGQHYLNVSSDFGASFLPEEIPIVSDLTRGRISLFWARMAVAENGLVAVQWFELTEGYGIDYFANYSQDGGMSWQPRDLRLDEGFDEDVHDFWLGDPGISSGGRVYLPWGKLRLPDESFAFVSVLSPDVVASAGASPELVPSSGGQVTVPFYVRNDSDLEYQNIAVWVDVTRPQGSVTAPLFGPIVVNSLAPGRALRKRRTFSIPALVPSGSYQMHLRLSGPIETRATLAIVKLP